MAARRATTLVSEEASGLWWLFLVIGIIWLWASLVVLRFDNRSITAVGVIMGVVFLGAAVNEAVIAGLSLGWRWAHWLLAVVFVLGALWALIRPEDAFWALASVLGFVLVIKGTADIGEAVATKPVYDLWWLTLVVGILEILLAFWVSQQFYPARASLLILWIGFAALFRGVTDISLAFSVRGGSAATETGSLSRMGGQDAPGSANAADNSRPRPRSRQGLVRGQAGNHNAR